MTNPNYKNKKISVVTLLTIAFLIVFSVLFSRAVFYVPQGGDAEALLPIATTETERIAIAKEINHTENIPRSYPSRLSVPAVDIDAKVEYVGITKRGNMSAPRGFSRVGWYKYGPEPGENGSAVIAGHVDNGLALPAVFWDLKNVKIGDDVYVEKIDGTQVHFKVTNIQTYDFDASAHEIFADSGESLLKLITCTGTWIPEYRTHNKRLVVTAEKVS